MKFEVAFLYWFASSLGNTFWLFKNSFMLFSKNSCILHKFIILQLLSNEHVRRDDLIVTIYLIKALILEILKEDIG